MGKVKDISQEKEATLYEMLNYLCSKVDFGNSFLDATAVRAMNTLFIELQKDNRKFEV